MSPRRYAPRCHHGRWLVAAVIFMALVWNEARAGNVSGIYEDTGSVASGDPQSVGAEVSLQALLGLEFDPVLASPRFSPASQVVITQTDTAFRIVCKDPHGSVTWSAQWKAGEGYGTEEGRVKLVLRSKRRDPDGFFFFMDTAADRQLLVVEVQRIIASNFGPAAKPQGMFVFERVPGGKPPGSPK